MSERKVVVKTADGTWAEAHDRDLTLCVRCKRPVALCPCTPAQRSAAMRGAVEDPDIVIELQVDDLVEVTAGAGSAPPRPPHLPA